MSLDDSMNEEKQEGIGRGLDNLPDDPERLKRLIGLILEEDARIAQQQEEALHAMKALISSWRWRLGNGVMSLAERLMRRKSVRLAADQVLDLLEQMTGQHRRRQALGAGYLAGLDARAMGFYAGPEGKERYTQECRQALAEFLESDARLDFTPSGQPGVSILLVLYNRAELTLACLRSILASSGCPVELIIVDNASSDDTSALLDRVDGAIILRNEENLGFLRACNQGAEKASGEFLLFLNNDAVLLEGSIPKAMQLFRDEAGVGAVGGRILMLDGNLQEAGSIVWNDGSCLGYGRGDAPHRPEYMFRRDVDYCSGAFLMTPLSLFREQGGFDEIYAPAYYEESDYCVRLQEQGYRVVFDPFVSILHYEFASSPPGEATALQRRNRQTFAERHRAWLEHRFPPSRKNVLQARFSDSTAKKVLYIDDRVPHCFLGSGFPRSNFILHTLEEQGCQVTLYPLNFPLEDTWDTVFSDISCRVEVMLGEGRRGLESHLKSRMDYYDTIFVSRPHNMEFFSQVAARIWKGGARPKVIYDAEAIFSLRDAAKYELHSGREHKRLEKNIRAEVSLVQDADLVITVSPGERQAFLRHYNGEVHVVGHALEARPTPAAFGARSGFLFVGNMDYDGSPNVDSVLWFVNEVFPRILEALPDVRLSLVGTNASSEIQGVADHPGVELLGRQESLEPFYDRTRVFVAPTRFAGGIPYKVHEAAAHGVPVVASRLLTGQLGWQSGEDILDADVRDPEAFASQCIDLYSNPELWQRVRDNALQRIAEECSASAMKGFIRRAFEAV